MNHNLSTNNSSVLSILDLRLLVHLGNSITEQLEAQEISIDITFSFNAPPNAIHTDDLTDTICYFHATELIRDIACKKPFKLIEHLTVSIYNGLHEYLINKERADVLLKVVLTKLHPPVPGVHGGVSFSYSGF